MGIIIKIWKLYCPNSNMEAICTDHDRVLNAVKLALTKYNEETILITQSRIDQEEYEKLCKQHDLIKSLEY